MNPSHFPQVLRSRSRSPSPVARPRVSSDSGGFEAVLHSGRVPIVEEGEQLLSVPQDDCGHERRLRSFSDNPHRVPQRRSRRGVVAELENMANVDTINTRHSINNRALPHHSDLKESGNDPDPDRTCTAQPGTAPNPRSADGGVSHSGEGGGYGSMTKGCGTCTPDQVDQIRRRVKFFFMDPWSKFKARQHLPWKMFFQLLKIIIVTVQLVQFGGQRSEIVEFFEGNQKALQHLLLKDWDPSYETMPYPPATGDYALYTVNDLLDSIDFAWENYHNLSEKSLASISLVTDKQTGEKVPIALCNSFNNYRSFPNGSFLVGAGVLHNCTDLVPLERDKQYDIRTFLQQKNLTIPFSALLELTLSFPLNTFHLNLIETHFGPTCYRTNATIHFKNYERSGKVLISLLTTNTEHSCSGKIMAPLAKEEEESVKKKNVGFDSFIIVICILSSVLCARSLFRAMKLKRTVQKLFKHRFGKELSFSDRMEFVNLWYILIIVNDAFTIVGSAFKIRLETRTVTMTSMNYDVCSLMLGLGGLLAWCGCLRYLGFFRKYNILILTLKIAFPNMLRFMVCALSIYAGFMFCGWVILSPYHIKFRELSTTSECLYSLVNGDDMFVTFSATVSNDNMIWYFSRIYLYSFISLFIYCVLSLFISVIMDTYETLKEYHDKGFPKTDLQQFIEQCNDTLQSGLYKRQHTENQATDFSLIECLSGCCCRRKPKLEVNENTRLLTQTI